MVIKDLEKARKAWKDRPYRICERLAERYINQLESVLAEREADARRLDWWTSKWPDGVIVSEYGNLFISGSGHFNERKRSLREAIDRAMSEDTSEQGGDESEPSERSSNERGSSGIEAMPPFEKIERAEPEGGVQPNTGADNRMPTDEQTHPNAGGPRPSTNKAGAVPSGAGETTPHPSSALQDALSCPYCDNRHHPFETATALIQHCFQHHRDRIQPDLTHPDPPALQNEELREAMARVSEAVHEYVGEWERVPQARRCYEAWETIKRRLATEADK